MSTITSEGIRVSAGSMLRTGPRHYRGQMQLLMLIADTAGFAAAAGVVLALNGLFKLFIVSPDDLKYAVVPLLCMVLFLNSKLYPGVGINPAEEIKLVVQYLTTGFVAGWILLLFLIQRWTPNHLAFPVLWALSIPSILVLRWGVRMMAAKLGLWGEPVVVIGRAQRVDRTIRYFDQRRRLGYVPVLVAIDTAKTKIPDYPVPVVELSALLNSRPDRFSRDGIQTALVDVPGVSEFFRSDESKALLRMFRRVIIVMDLDWIDGAAMRIQDFEGMIGIAAEKSVLTPSAALLKRTLDILVAGTAGLLALPFMLIAAIAIKLDSPGGVFYTQERLGKDGSKIKVYKFRSMFCDAEKALQAYLQNNEKARGEWDASQKLCEDPRVTRTGRLLRKFSIDELPQLINVFKGEMSLVGPRPIVEAEAHHYGEKLDVYLSTCPGISGLWQVSGRSRTSYEERVRYDTYYVRNWSLWLDLYVLLRTVWVVLKRDGAY